MVIIEKVDTTIVAREATYIPHREVIREDHLSTKLHVVFDCSAKCGENISLTQSLLKSPCLIPRLFDFFIKFRLYPVTAGIEKVYLHINVHKSHEDYLRFLWFGDINSENPVIDRYRFYRILFGATCSQFLLNATIGKHVSKYEKIDAEFARKLRNHFYVMI